MPRRWVRLEQTFNSSRHGFVNAKMAEAEAIRCDASLPRWFLEESRNLYLCMLGQTTHDLLFFYRVVFLFGDTRVGMVRAK